MRCWGPGGQDIGIASSCFIGRRFYCSMLDLSMLRHKSGVRANDRIQSHDLPTSSAQKASSVSPAHFKSALIRARRLLSQAEEVSSSNSPSSSKRTSPRTAAGPGAGAGPSLDPLSPFTTPRKKRTYTSGIDVSDLLKSGSKHAHTPATGSPLKFSSTTTTTRKEDKEEDISRTPTKRVKYGAVPVQGVDLATVQVEEGASARKRRREDTSAFMALRPDQSSVRVQQEVDRGDELPEEEKEYLSSIREKRRTRPKGSREGLKRKDWAFREGIWDSGDVRKKNEILLERVSILTSGAVSGR